ncbi:MAG: polyphosphate kinase 1 [Treponema sp.]|nr:polyphosphate kinase 1 [Candidatus Treponema merdequi]
MQKNIFFNRELSWIEFNNRVLFEACRKDIPLLERVQFLSIVTSNFNEFFQVRVASIKRAQKIDNRKKDISGFTPSALLKQISVRAHEVVNQKNECLHNEVIPLLEKEGYVYVKPEKMTLEQKTFCQKEFNDNILPLLTPLRTDTETFPLISNLQYHAAFLLKPMSGINPMNKEFFIREGKQAIAFVQIPNGINRLIWLPAKTKAKQFTLIDNLILEYGTALFPGFEVKESMIFNVIRDADFAVDEDSGNNFIEAMEEVLIKRQSSFAVRLNCNNSSGTIKKFLMKNLELSADDIYECDELIDPGCLLEIGQLEETSKYKFESWEHFYSKSLPEDEPYWDTLKQKDVLLHVPYESYNPVVKFITDAAEDPSVIAIKMTLYRTGNDSPIISALKKAAQNGKQVTVLVELKARFDEERNIAWANELERAGVIVIQGIVNLKVHAKILMVIRKEDNSIKRYVHLSTGNYNPKTARLYSDLSLFTSNSLIANDATTFFNIVTGYSALQSMKVLSMAPVNLKSNILAMIQREIRLSTPANPGLIIAKMNSLTHEEVINALYDASRAGVKVMLNIRGICMLVPGVKGMSENIQVISIVDRYLEHERIFYFKNGNQGEIYLSSADWMDRNLDRRIELMFPVLEADIFNEIKETLDTYFKSNMNAHQLRSDGVWIARRQVTGTESVRAQEILYKKFKKIADKKTGPKIQFKVRRK